MHPNERNGLIIERNGYRATIADYMVRIANMQGRIVEITHELGDGGLDTVMWLGDPPQRVYDAGQHENPPE